MDTTIDKSSLVQDVSDSFIDPIGSVFIRFQADKCKFWAMRQFVKKIVKMLI